MTVKIHPSWKEALSGEFEKPYWGELTEFVKSEYSTTPCFPAGKDIFRAFDMTPFDSVKIVILGQDPYHSFASEKGKVKSEKSETGEKSLENTPAAMGLSFSVPNGSKPQPSLRNIFKEIESDIGVSRTKTDLSDWAEQGVLLLNAVLTVRQGYPASHSGKGWENFTDAAIRTISEKRDGIVFILWGNYAIRKRELIDNSKHHIITSPHPSPFSAHNGFFGSRPFSRANAYLREEGSQEIMWGE